MDAFQWISVVLLAVFVVGSLSLAVVSERRDRRTRDRMLAVAEAKYGVCSGCPDGVAS